MSRRGERSGGVPRQPIRLATRGHGISGAGDTLVRDEWLKQSGVLHGLDVLAGLPLSHQS